MLYNLKRKQLVSFFDRKRMRRYSKYENVLNMLRRHVNQRRREGNLRLEGERELMIRFGTSRKTLAKAQETLIAENVLYREKQSTRITPAVRQKGRYAYVPYFHRLTGVFWFDSNRRIWETLRSRGMEELVAVDLVPFDPEYPGETVETLAEKLRDYSVVFLFLIRADHLKKLCPRLRELGVRVVFLDESDSCADSLLLTEDYYHSGVIAAKALLAGGYRHPVLMGCSISRDSRSICKRIQGFHDTMAKHGIRCPELFYPYEKRLQGVMELSNWLSRIREQGKDSVYFPLDSYLELITLPLYEQGLVPEQVGIVSSDNTLNASRHNPPITYTADCVPETVEALLAFIRLNEQERWNEIPRQTFIKSRLVTGMSIRENNKRRRE